MELKFSKYQATGNDFIVVNGDHTTVPTDAASLSRICDRRFGVGADGFIVVGSSEHSDFSVEYYNPDGSRSFCGNGARSAVKFAFEEGLFRGEKTVFDAYDGIHHAELLQDGEVRISMSDVQNVRLLEDGIFLDTGSPHLVVKVPDVETEDVVGKGRTLRYNTVEGGTNVNFVEYVGRSHLRIRTYERGVEAETWSCGTGVTAAALTASLHEMNSPVSVQARGGLLKVEFKKTGSGGFSDIYLTGPAMEVFKGTLRS